VLAGTDTGYSFPSTDFNTKRLFLESFADNVPEQLIIVNPNGEAAEKARDSCHFKGEGTR